MRWWFILATACNGGGGEACPNEADDEPGDPVSFQAEVLPVFQRSCGLSGACHGSEVPSAPNQPYLGPPAGETPTPAQIDAILRQTVDVAAVGEGSLTIVEPASPSRSFLWAKLRMGADDACDLPCADDDGCGDGMPLGGSLGDADQDVIRRWIAQGALQN